MSPYTSGAIYIQHAVFTFPFNAIREPSMARVVIDSTIDDDMRDMDASWTQYRSIV